MQNLEQLLDVMSDALIAIDDDQRIVLFNRAAMAMFGYTDAEITGQPLNQLMPPGAASNHARHVERFRAAGEARKVMGGRPEIRGRRKDGSEFPASAALMRFQFEGKALMGAVVRDLSEQRELERTVRETEARLQATFEHAAVGMAHVGPDGRFLRVNPELCRILGYSREELLKRTFRDLTHPGDMAAGTLAKEDLLSGRAGSIHQEKRYLRRDGSVVWASLTATLVRNANGAPDYFISVVRDITQRKAAEETAARSAQRYRTLFAESPVGMALRKTDGSFVDVNSAFAEMLGYSREELVGRTVWFITPRKFHKADHGHIEELMRTGHIPPYEKEYLHKNGHAVPVRVRAFTQQENGEQLVWISAEDLRDLRRAQTVERSLANAQRIARMGNWDWNVEAGSLSWSDEIYRIFGLPREEFGASYEAFLRAVHPDDRQLVQHSVDAALRGEAPYSISHRILLPGGEQRIVHEQGEITFDDAGKAIRMSGTVQDITEQAATESQLMQAQKMEALGQLTGGVAHDFNNLLSVIIGNIELARKRLTGDAAAQPLLDSAHKAAGRGAALVQHLLAFARRKALQPKQTDLNHLVTSLITIIQRTLGAHIAVHVLPGDNVWPCMIDPAQMETTLINLAINARDAMPQGGALTIETDNTQLDGEFSRKNAVAPGDYVRVTVSDSGTGMTPEVLARVFDPFFTTKAEGAGTGLGLSMVHGFIKQSGGHIRIYSEPGSGTVVKLFLPRAQLGAVSEPAQEPLKTAPMGSGQLILVVDDNEALRELNTICLTDLGYRVVTAADGPAALQAARRHPDFVLLLTDVVLPGPMRGPDIAAALRGERGWLPVLYMSGYTKESLSSQGLLEAGTRLIEKPFQVPELAQAIAELLRAPPPSGLKGGSAHESHP